MTSSRCRMLMLGAATLIVLFAALFAGMRKTPAYHVSFSDSSLEWVIAESSVLRSFGRFDSADRAISSVISMGASGPIRLVRGNYRFNEPVTVQQNNVTILLDEGAILKPSTSGSIGLFSFTNCSDSGIRGRGTVLVEQALSQTIIAFQDSHRVLVEDVTFDVTGVGSQALPTTLVSFTGSDQARVTKCSFYPNRGVRCIVSSESDYLEVCDSHFSRPPGTTVNRECARVVSSSGGQAFQFVRNRVTHLGPPFFGTFSPGLAFAAMTITRSDGGSWLNDGFQVGDTFNVINAEDATNNLARTISAVTSTVISVAAASFVTNAADTTAKITKGTLIDECIVSMDTATDQAGDRVENNQFEDLTTAVAVVHLRGRKSFVVRNNRFAACLGMGQNNYVTRFDSTVYVENKNQTISSPTLEYSARMQVSDNEFDGNAQGTASEIYVRSCTKGAMVGNHFTQMGSNQAITIDADHSQNIRVVSNYFDGAWPTNLSQLFPIRILNRLSEDSPGETAASGAIPLWQMAENIIIEGNYCEGYQLGLSAAALGFDTFPPILGVRGTYFWTGLSGFGEVLSAANVFSFTAPNLINATSAQFANIKTGDWITVVQKQQGGSPPPISTKNTGLRLVLAVAGTNDQLTLLNPNLTNNSDPTFAGGTGWTIENQAASPDLVVSIFSFRKADVGTTTALRPLSTNISAHNLTE